MPLTDLRFGMFQFYISDTDRCSVTAQKTNTFWVMKEYCLQQGLSVQECRCVTLAKIHLSQHLSVNLNMNFMQVTSTSVSYNAIRCKTNFDVLLTVRCSIFISVFNQLDAQNLFHNKFYHASTCFEHMCSSPGDQNCITQPLVSSDLQVTVWCNRQPPIGVMIPEAV